MNVHSGGSGGGVGARICSCRCPKFCIFIITFPSHTISFSSKWTAASSLALFYYRYQAKPDDEVKVHHLIEYFWAGYLCDTICSNREMATGTMQERWAWVGSTFSIGNDSWPIAQSDERNRKTGAFAFHRNRRDFSFISGDWEVRANWTNWFLSENSHGNSTFIEKRLALAREQKHKIWCASVPQAASPNWIALHIYTNGCLCNARCWVIRSPKRNENRENDPTKAAQDSREEKKFLVSLCCRRSVFPCFRFIHSTPPCFFFSFPTSLAPFFPFAASVIIIIINGTKHLGWNRRGFD